MLSIKDVQKIQGVMKKIGDFMVENVIPSLDEHDEEINKIKQHIELVT